MKRDKVLAMFAWFFDLIVSECLIWPMHALYNDSPGGLNYLWALFPLSIFILSILYHVRWKQNVQWISPGEYLSGQRLIAGEKVSVRLYSIHRTFMFFIILINVLCITKSLEVTFYGMDNAWTLLLLSYGFNFLILFGSIKLSESSMSGMICIGIALAFMIGNHAVDYFHFNIQSGMTSYLFYLLLFVANMGIYNYYSVRKVTGQESIREKSIQVYE